MTLLQTMARGVQASITWNNINISEEYTGSISGQGGGGSIDLVGDRRASYEKIYLTQIWVHSIVNKLSRGIGRLPLKVYLDGDESRERVRSGPLADVLQRPWPGGTPFALKSAIVANIGVFGNSVVVPVRLDTSRSPTELLPSSFAYWHIVPGKDGKAEWYVYRNGASVIPFLPREVLHYKWWGTGADLVGASPVAALHRTLTLEDAAQRMHISSYEHGMRPSGAYTVEGPQPPKEDLERMRAELDRLYGGVDNAFRTAILGGGAKWSPMAHSLADSEIINTRKLNREECAAAYDMPPPVIQILDKATFSNISEQHLMLYMDTMGPWTTMFEETTQAQLIDPEPAFQGHYVEFDLAEVLKGDITKRMEAYKMATFMAENEKRRAENMPRIDHPLADMIWMPLNMRPVGPDAEDYMMPQGAPPSGATGAMMAEDIHCPQCDALLAKNVDGRAETKCKCGALVPIG